MGVIQTFVVVTADIGPEFVYSTTKKGFFERRDPRVVFDTQGFRRLFLIVINEVERAEFGWDDLEAIALKFKILTGCP